MLDHRQETNNFDSELYVSNPELMFLLVTGAIDDTRIIPTQIEKDWYLTPHAGIFYASSNIFDVFPSLLLKKMRLLEGTKM